jgi:hypothetical protein
MSNSIIQTFENGEDLSAGRYLIMKLSTGKLVKSSAATDTLLGVLNENAIDSATSGNQLGVCVSGIAYVKAGAAFPAGAFLITNASGKAIETAGATDIILGQALETADADGDVVKCLVNIGPK